MFEQTFRNVRFLDDGRIDLNTNPVERAIRPIDLGRKNSLFAGSDGGACRWAIVASLVETAKLNGVEPFAWLRNSLTLMIEGHPVSCLDYLMHGISNLLQRQIYGVRSRPFAEFVNMGQIHRSGG